MKAAMMCSHSAQALSSRALIREGAERLHKAGMGRARHEAEWLLSRMLGTRPLNLYIEERPIQRSVVDQFFSHIRSRAAGMPLQYILQEEEFLGERLTVTQGVFIPRPETEVVVAEAINALRYRASKLSRPLRLLDLGTGCGCICVALASALPACVVIGVDISWKAVSVAAANIRRGRHSSIIHLVQGSWVRPIRGMFDGIVSNPPYIPSDQLDCLPLEVRREPRLSLDGGSDGLRALYQLVSESPRVLLPGGVLALECGEEQASKVIQWARAGSWTDTATVVHDLARRPRGVIITRTGSPAG